MTVVELGVERWEAYAQATRAEHFAHWARAHCVQSVDRFAGLPLELERWQLEMMSEALAELEPDEAYWLVVALVIPKKNGKTSLLAAYALYHLLEDEGAPEILLAAATDKQAGRLFTTAVRFVRSDPWLSAQLVVREHEGEISRVDGFGSLFRFSADTGAASGYNPSLVVADELKDWTTPRRRRVWADIATAGLARDYVHLLVISTAGEPEERVDGILGQLIDGNELEGELERVGKLTISRNHAGRTLVYNYDARTLDSGDLDAIKAANPASWVTRERLGELSASPTLTPGRFLQLHGCVWATSESGYLELEAWRALEAEGAELHAGDELAVGFRGADSCALVACRRSDAVLFTLEVWEPAGGRRVELEDVDDALMAAAELYNVDAVYASATPAWATLVNAWRHVFGKREVVDVDVASPGPRTAQITERFRADALAGRVRHDGDRRLARHVVAARLQRSRNLPYLAESSRAGSPIAGALAAMLAWEARTLLGPVERRRKGPVSF
jgi:hypothetical protein